MTRGLDDLMRTLHGMAEGRCFVLGADARRDLQFNTLMYDDLIHALRGNLPGSGWGVYEFTDRVDGSLLIAKSPEADAMTLDRDARPLPIAEKPEGGA